jgi:hypothetical protein
VVVKNTKLSLRSPGLLEGLLARLMGRYPLSSRFITQTRRGLPMVSLPER